MFLGLDLGTSGLRALLVEEHGNILCTAEIRYNVEHPKLGWREQDPVVWTSACNQVFEKMRVDYPSALSAVKAIGVSGHMHGATLVDHTGEVLRPCILWNDTRAQKQASKLDATAGVQDISGNIVFPGFTAPKLTWIAENEPEVFSKIAKVLLPKDYLNFWLTGQYSSEMSDAAGTSWLDTGGRCWSKDLLALSGMRQEQMPRLFEGTEIIGNLRSNLVKKWGFAPNVAVVAGGGDNAATACGVGVLNEGDSFISLGTSGVMLVVKKQYLPNPQSAVHTFCHAIPNRWIQMGVILSATDSLNWLSRNLGVDVSELSRSLGNKISGPNRTLFLPYLSGERTPHNDSKIRGAFLNIDIATSRNDLTQAVMEGVSFALRDNLEVLNSTGTCLKRSLVIGGGSQSLFWLELLATVLNLPLDIPKQSEFGAALGAARLAMAGFLNVSLETIMAKPNIEKTIYPCPDLIERYKAAYDRYRELYPLLKTIKE